MRRFAILSGVIAFVADGVYVYIVTRQGGDDGTLRVPFVMAFIAVCGIVCLVSVVVPLKGARLVLLSFSSIGMLVLGFLAAFSIGLLLWLAAVPALIASFRLLVSPLPRILSFVTGGVIALLVLAAGMWATQFPVRCPPGGASSGSGVGFLTGDYHWTCVNGKLTVAPGECQSWSGSGSPNGQTTVICNH